MLTNLSIIIGTILSLGVVFQLVTNMILATPVEYHLESNYRDRSGWLWKQFK